MTEAKVKKAGNQVIVPENPVSKYLFNSTSAAWIWLIVRLYLGYAWLTAGLKKVTSPTWTGEEAGKSVTGFINGALAKAADGKDVTGWYAAFLENVALPNAKAFSFIVAYGELLVGIGLIVGLLIGVAAFFGSIMNVSFLFAGTNRQE
jgi:thiosulfate dehydrogenase [quinone] large subunit